MTVKLTTPQAALLHSLATSPLHAVASHPVPTKSVCDSQAALPVLHSLVSTGLAGTLGSSCWLTLAGVSQWNKLNGTL